MKRNKKFPLFSAIFLLFMVGSCVLAEYIMPYDPHYLDLVNAGKAPCKQYIFGTDMLGRDLYSMIWFGGRLSLFIGVMATMISTAIAILYGGVSGFAKDSIDGVLMKLLNLLLCVPSILLLLFLQGVLKNNSPCSIAFVIGATSWMSMAKVIRSEVRQIRNSNYILCAKKMGGGFLYLLRVHFVPNIISSILFMIIMNVGSAIALEATLSFLGLGMPIEQVSWGTMLSNADQALLTNQWWNIVIPGIFLTGTILSMMSLGSYYKQDTYKKCSNLPRNHRKKRKEIRNNFIQKKEL